MYITLFCVKCMVCVECDYSLNVIHGGHTVLKKYDLKCVFTVKLHFVTHSCTHFKKWCFKILEVKQLFAGFEKGALLKYTLKVLVTFINSRKGFLLKNTQH